MKWCHFSHSNAVIAGCLPSQGKVREFTLFLEKSGEKSGNLGKSQGISVKSRNLC